MIAPADAISISPASKAPAKLSKLNDWKASVLQSVLLFCSFGLIVVGVALEAETVSGLLNGFWAVNLVVPATGFMLSLVNWYFVRIYKSRRRFSAFSALFTLAFTLCAFIWTAFHYEAALPAAFSDLDFAEALEMLQSMAILGSLGIMLTAIFCLLSETLSNKYAEMLGKE